MYIKISNLKKFYKERQILDINDLEIKKGKITGIVGPNGSGKTTLLNIISGLDNNYDGVVTYDGNNINYEILKNITLVFQKPYLVKTTVYENIQYPLKIRKIDKIDRNKKVTDILKRLDMYKLKDKNAHLLSGGESQKVALARALVFEPSLLLLDEPTSNIDIESTEIIEREILKYNKELKATVIIITHDLNQAKRLCDDIICLKKGKVVS